jgi:hypothetical protein
MTHPHPCPLPTRKRRWRNMFYACDCGAVWRLRYWTNYACDGWEWVRVNVSWTFTEESS